jgi:hypothetical protein
MPYSNNLIEIWNTYSDRVLNENTSKTKSQKHGTKPGKKPVLPNDIKHGFKDEDTSGPANIDGLKDPIDPKTAKKEDELYNSASFSSQNYSKNDKKIEKKVKESINNYMKSTFDKLFENVMGDDAQELEALGIDTENDVEETDEGDVTVTLDREMAKSLCDLLQAAIGDEDDGDEDDGEEDYEGEEGFNFYSEGEEDEDEDTVGEATELKAVPAAAGHGLTSTGNNKVGSIKPKSKKASGSTKKYEEGEPKELGDKKAHLQSKKNKVALSQGQDFIQ